MAPPCTRTASPERSRRDGWTPERQVAFLAALGVSHSVTDAARAAGMSRESAYRLRNRPGAALFAHLWDQALAPAPLSPGEDHTPPLSSGRLIRLLGNRYRRQSGDFARFAQARADARKG